MGQIGTIRVDTQNNGTVSVPVFDTGDSGSSIYEFVRVQTANGTGFIPVEDTGSATYPFLRVRSQSHGTVAMTDRSTAIPDSVVHRYDATQLSLSAGASAFTWPDLEGSADLLPTGNATYQTATIGGNPSVLYDGTDDAHEGAFASTVNQPDYIVGVIQVEGTGGNPAARIWSSSDQNERQIMGVNSALGEVSDFFVFAGSGASGGPRYDNGAHIIGTEYDGVNSQFRYDGVQSFTADIGVNDLPGIRLGSDPDDTEFGNFRAGEVWVMDSPSDSDINAAESQLASKWGIEI